MLLPQAPRATEMSLILSAAAQWGDVQGDTQQQRGWGSLCHLGNKEGATA